ncbi:ABC transporter ATP-binding protein [Imperialibacter roseus]|uniref:ABC transporter ATP-binding protein n=1 Tax=Imperialibacter roseus TaxID=1324217 RepID=A0ABZ0ISK7_9BACT|nr:ABC transporter ATP-binding protein [Imperialibacter roseus]WOK06577.1 ABC transporter ATP-binding protein [Imperialibacter roseus]
MQLVIKDLSKTYSDNTQALKNINLTVYQGMFGLLGPNGAGKSTLMRIIATLQHADSGTITLGDIDVLQQKETVRQILGYLPQEFGLYPRVSAETLLDHLASLKGLVNRGERKEVVDAMLQRTNLWEARKRNLGAYSGGMKQRFGIAQALIANPKLIIVDEPTAGLDPAERNRILNLLSEIGESTIVILSTHIVDDINELCTHVGIISNGTLLFKGRPIEAIESIQGKIWKKRVSKAELLEAKNHFNVISERLLAGSPQIHVYSDEKPDEHFEEVAVDLEEVYFSKIFEEGTVAQSH